MTNLTNWATAQLDQSSLCSGPCALGLEKLKFNADDEKEQILVCL